MIDEAIKEKMKERRFELYLSDLFFCEYTAEEIESSKYRVIVNIRNVNSNIHYSVVVKEIASQEFPIINGWILKDIWFQSDWNNLDWPLLTVVDPNGDELSPKIPYPLQAKIEERIPNWKVNDEDILNRITEGLKIFREVTNYPDKKRYLLINSYNKTYSNGVLKMDLEEWGERLIQIHESRKDFSEEQLDYFFNLYVKQLREYFETKRNKEKRLQNK